MRHGQSIRTSSLQEGNSGFDTFVFNLPDTVLHICKFKTIENCPPKFCTKENTNPRFPGSVAQIEHMHNNRPSTLELAPNLTFSLYHQT